jgi:hypothetical protein
MGYRRTLELERAEVDLSTGDIGEIPVFTGGEASDGHRLSIAGVRAPGEMPLFVQHEPDPRTQLGTLSEPRVRGDSLFYRGRILTEGTGPEADIRRDLLLKIAHGHVKRLSGRWDAEPENVVPRRSLKKDHPAFSDGAGLFFSQWTPMEGSIVGLGSDPAAVIRWAEEAQSADVADFWRSWAPGTPIPPTEELAWTLDELARHLETLGWTPPASDGTVKDEEPDEAAQTPTDDAAAPLGRMTGETPPPMDLERFGERLSTMLERHREHAIDAGKALVSARLGRLPHGIASRRGGHEGRARGT